MSTLEITLTTIVVMIVLCSFGVGIALYMRSKVKREEANIAASKAMVEALNAFRAGTDSYLKLMEDFPALMRGLVKVSAAHVKEVGNLRIEVKNLREAIFKKDDVRPFEGPAGDRQKDLVYRAQELSNSSGISLGDALMRVVGEDSQDLEGEFNLG